MINTLRSTKINRNDQDQISSNMMR